MKEQMDELNKEIIEVGKTEKEEINIEVGETNVNEEINEEKELITENIEETSIGNDEESNNKSSVKKETVPTKISKSNKTENDMFDEGQGLTKAGKRKKKEMYRDNSIITIGDAPAIASEGEKKKQAYLELVTSLKTKTPLKGIISSSRVIADHLTAVILYGDIQVLIPVEKLAVFDITIHGTEKEQATFKRMLVNQRLGAEVEFIVEQIKESDRLAIGNRVAALTKRKKEYFLTRDRHDKFKINEGDKAEARIVYTAIDRIGIELFGFECDLRQKDISYTRIADVTQDYEPGDIIAVKVMHIEREIVEVEGKKKWDFKCSVSAKEAQPDPRKEHFYYYAEGTGSLADVTQIDESGVYVRLGGKTGKMDALIPFGQNAQIDPSITKGTRLQVQITHVDEDQLRLFARIVRIVKKAN